MDPIKKLFKELGSEVYKVIILESLLNTGVFFFASMLILGFLKFNILAPLALSVIFFIASVSYGSKKFQLKVIEDKNPEVKVMLRTARDNINSENLLTLALFNELIEKMKNVSVGYIVDEKKVVTKLIVVGVLAFLSIWVTTADLWNIDLGFDNFNIFKNRPLMAMPSIFLNETDSIYGDIRVAKLGNEMLTIQINPTLSDIDLTKVSDAEKRDLNLNNFPVDIGAQSDKVSNEEKPKEFQLAKDYNL